MCSATEGSLCSRSAIACLVDAGADIQAHVQISDPDSRTKRRFTCLHCLVLEAHSPSTNDELESLVYLIQNGVDVRAVDCEGRSVSIVAYKLNYIEPELGLDHFGGYRGDLWDAALATCGYDLLEFRKDYPRTPRYGTEYERADFERLWEGIEERCPYWDHGRWPETGGDSDHWMTDYADTSESSGESDLDDGDYSDCQYDGNIDYIYKDAYSGCPYDRDIYSASEDRFSECPYDRDIDSASGGEMSATEGI